MKYSKYIEGILPLDFPKILLEKKDQIEKDYYDIYEIPNPPFFSISYFNKQKTFGYNGALLNESSYEKHLHKSGLYERIKEVNGRYIFFTSGIESEIILFVVEKKHKKTLNFNELISLSNDLNLEELLLKPIVTNYFINSIDEVEPMENHFILYVNKTTDEMFCTSIENIPIKKYKEKLFYEF